MVNFNVAKFPRMSSVIPKLFSISPHPPSTKILELNTSKLCSTLLNQMQKVKFITYVYKLITTTTNAPFCYVSLAKLMGLQLLATKGG
jgi:hypothetical protein